MLKCDTAQDVRRIRLAEHDQSWGLVPTMGFLHEGHLSLVRRARTENDRVAVSIFVNPTQFAPTEDLQSYPRDLERDIKLLGREGVDLVFTPSEMTMYPPGFQTSVMVSELTQHLEGASRPTHFQGVTTIVAKLFNIVNPHRAYFGQKDAQQAIVIRRMVEDLNFGLDIVVCPIIREPDGLAMSSRNARLTSEQRSAAPVLYRALSAAAEAVMAGERNASVLHDLMTDIIAREPLSRLDYVSVADANTLQELERVDRDALLSGAIFVGDVRLIDNVPI